MTSLDILLENYWILQEQDSEKYENLRNNITEEEIDFIKHKLGFKLIVNPYLVKLEKIPAVPNEFMGISEFQTKLDYFFLCMILIFLEDKSKKEQFILSGLIEFIENYSLQIDTSDIKVDFTLFKQRQAMVRVLKYIRTLGFIKLYDGDENKFAENIENDALYEITGVSKYYVRNFISNIADCNSYMDICKKEQLGLIQQKGIERKQRVYRKIFLEPIVYQETLEDLDYDYIKKFRNVISRDCDILFNSSFEVHKNGAYMLLSDEKSYKNVFPTNRAICDIVLLVNKKLRDLLDEKKIVLSTKNTFYMSKLEFSMLIKSVKEEFFKGFSKEYRMMEDEKFEIQIQTYMSEFNMLKFEEENQRFEIMPIVWKIGGVYPESFNYK